MATTGKVPILETAKAALDFWRTEWRTFAPFSFAAAALITPVQIMGAMAQARGDPGGELLATLGALPIMVVLLAALYRRALSQGAAPMKFALGRDEANLAGVYAALLFFYLIVILLLVLVVAMALAGLLAGADLDPARLQTLAPEAQIEAVSAALGSEGAVIIGVVLGLSLALLFWLGARLTLAHAATIAEGRIRIFDTWAWTKGNGVPIMAVMTILVVVIILAALIIVGPAALFAQAVLSGGESPSPASPGGWVISFVNALLSTLVATPLLAGAGAYLYRGLKPQA